MIARFRRSLLTTLAAAPALGVAAPAFAQEAVDLGVGVSARVEYDSNVARSDAASAAARGVRPEDVRFVPSLTVNLDKAFGRNSLFLKGAVGYVAYAHNHRLDRESIDLQGGARGRLAACNGVLTGGVARRQSDLQDLSLDVTRNTETNTSVALDVGCGRAIGLAPSVTVSRAWTDNSNEDRKTLNSRTTAVRAAVAYRRPVFGTFAVLADYTKTEFPDRLVLVDGDPVRDGYEVRSVGVRYERKLGARIEVTGELLHTSVKSRLPGVPEFSGATYLADASLRVGGRTRLHAGLGRQIRASNRQNGIYSVTRNFDVGADYRVGPRLDLTVGYEHLDSRTTGSDLIGPIDLVHDRINSGYAGIRWRMNRRVTLALDVRREHRTADDPAFDYSSTRVGIAARARF